MNAAPQLRVRRSIQELQDQYTAGNTKPLEDLWRAWAKIRNFLPAINTRSSLWAATMASHSRPWQN